MISRSMKNNTQISGPFNLVRLEGIINNKQKVLYLFMDLHIDPDSQTECTDIRSIHIKNYLVDTFDNIKNTDTKIDFFLETFPDQVGFTTRKTDIYLNQIRNLFERSFNYDFKKNIALKSKEFSNVRFHYMDIRPYFTFKLGDPFGLINEISREVYSLANRVIHQNDLFLIKNGTNILHSQMKIIHDACFLNDNSKKETKQQQVHSKLIREFVGNWINYEYEDATHTIKHLINKIKNVYSNKQIGEVIHKLFLDKLTIMFNEYNESYDKLLHHLSISIPQTKYSYYDRVKYNGKYTYYGFVSINISDKIFNDILPIFEKYRSVIVDIYIFIMDLYFIRRFLDKDYVTNGVVYTGAYHSSNYIKFLLKHFDFKITHAFFSETKDLNKLNEQIVSMDDTEKILGMFYPSKLYQCINVEHFPKNFA